VSEAPECDPLPSVNEFDVEALLSESRNWGRWGEEDEVGAVNLITPAKIIEAASLVRSGRSISLSRVFPKHPSPINPEPALHFLKRTDVGSGGHVTDFYGISYHGLASTHLDALCHFWGPDGIYNGRQPDDVISYDGATFGAIDKWSSGLVTRGVLIDVPRFRGEDFVEEGLPVHCSELEEICRVDKINVKAGDALLVYCGRDAWSRSKGEPWGIDRVSRPGLHVSCLRFVREKDVAILVLDMMESPNGLDIPRSVHSAIPSFGLALLDNALLEPLVQACREEQRTDFMFMTAPLRVAGGTGSPVNPLAIL
jgi:kynurenine formamidase